MSAVHPQVLTQSPKQVVDDIAGVTQAIGTGYRRALLFFGGLLVLGIIGFIWRAADAGFDSFRPWGYFMGAYAFLLTTASSAPLFSVTQRMVRSHWRRPMARASEMFGVVGILSTLMFIPLILMLPAAGSGATRELLDEGRRTIWFEFPGTPLFTDLLFVVFLAVLGIALLYVTSYPDMVGFRSRAVGVRKRILDVLLFVEWRGTERQWKVQGAAINIMGALYFLLLIGVHTVIASDFAEAMVPGWRDAIFPAYHALAGLQCAVASTIVAMFLLYRFGGFKQYISVDQFWGASKIMLSLSLLWAYFWFSGFIVYWYGRQPVEQNILKLFMFDAYRVPFLISFFLQFLVPFLVLLWNFARKSILGPTIVASAILLGALVDRLRIYVASFQIGDLRSDALREVHPEVLAEVPNPILPGTADIFMVAGTLGGGILLYLLAMKVIPVLSMWEIKEGLLYRRRRRFLKMDIMVMGKPE